MLSKLKSVEIIEKIESACYRWIIAGNKINSYINTRGLNYKTNPPTLNSNYLPDILDVCILNYGEGEFPFTPNYEDCCSFILNVNNYNEIGHNILPVFYADSPIYDDNLRVAVKEFKIRFEKFMKNPKCQICFKL